MAGWVDSWDLPIYPWEQGDYDRCGWAAGIINLPGGTGDRIGQGGRLKSAKLGVGEQRD